MAAHVLTALGQIAQELGDGIEIKEPNWGNLEGALKLSCWTEDLDYDDYIDLDVIIEERDAWELVSWVEDIAYKYLYRWAERGFPANREEWHGKSK